MRYENETHTMHKKHHDLYSPFFSFFLHVTNVNTIFYSTLYALMPMHQNTYISFIYFILKAIIIKKITSRFEKSNVEKCIFIQQKLQSFMLNSGHILYIKSERESKKRT